MMDIFKKWNLMFSKSRHLFKKSMRENKIKNLTPHELDRTAHGGCAARIANNQSGESSLGAKKLCA